MDTLQVREEEIATLQATLPTKYNKDKDSLRYAFTEPRIEENKVEINYFARIAPYLIVTDTGGVGIFPNRVSINQEVYVDIARNKLAPNLSYYCSKDELRCALRDNMETQGTLYVNHASIDYWDLAYCENLCEIVNAAAYLSRKTNRSLTSCVQFLVFLSKNRMGGMVKYSITNPANEVYSLNFMNGDTCMFQLLIMDHHPRSCWYRICWYRDYGKIMRRSLEYGIPAFPSGFYVVEVIVGAKKHKFTSELLANNETFDRIHLALFSYIEKIQSQGSSSTYAALNLTEAMSNIV
jgi:hypothetical protein